jgi:hypothetical protein
MDSVFVAMDLIRIPLHYEEPSEVLCSRCFCALERHQLDIELPSRIVGSCESCKAWYLIDVEEGLMVLLPDEQDLRGA